MIRSACCALALSCLAIPSAADRAAEAAVRLEWPGGSTVRCSVPLGASRLLLRFETDPAGPIRLVAGLDAPFLLAGPLAAAGLLREAAGPLTFDPGSSVFQEATGLRFDGSASGPEDCSVQVTLAPDACALFWLNPDSGPGILGCAVGARSQGPVSLDAVITLCDREGDGTGEEWILPRAPGAAGRVVHAASRIGISRSGLSVTVSGGLSAAERSPPGWFSLCTAHLGRDDGGIDLLAAGASHGYLDLGGAGYDGGFRTGIRFRLAGLSARIRAGYVMHVSLPGFVPGPFLPSVQQLVLVMERRWPARNGTWEAGLSASNRIETASDGTAGDDPSGAVSAAWRSDLLQAGAFLEVDRDDGTAVGISACVPDAAGKGGAGGEMRCAWTGDGGIRLDVSAHARFVCGSGEFRLQGGVRGSRPGAGGFGDPWGSVEWRVSDRPVSPSRGRAPLPRRRAGGNRRRPPGRSRG